jgi:hypothetical protein
MPTVPDLGSLKMSKAYSAVTFVDANPGSSRSVRDQELIRSKARAHAAKISHPSFRNPKSRPLKLPTKKSTVPIKEEDDDDHGVRDEKSLHGPPHKFHSYIPKYKGNSDPFNSTAVPYTPLEHSIVKWSRSMQIVTAWPSDISLRQNMPKMLEAGRTAIGNLVDDPATIHAFISYSSLHYYAIGRLNQTATLDSKYLKIAKKHSTLALRRIQELVQTQNNSQSRQGLEKVWHAATWLAASNIYSGNLGEAHLHFSAAMKLVDMMGGLKALPDAESGLMIHAIIGLAMMMRARPIIEPEEFDPGTCCEQAFASVISDTHIDFGVILSQPPLPPPVDPSRPSTMSAMQRAVFAEMRELLLMEEYKVKHARSRADVAEKVFRWSHFRKLAVRARNVHYWCDLVEARRNSLDSNSSGSQTIPPSPPTAAPDDTFDTCLVHATRLFDRCVFEEQYSPKGPFPLSKGNYMQLLKGMGEVRASSTAAEIAARRFDMLWIASAGAYFEDTFLQQRFAVGAGPGPVTYFFAPMFTKLVAELELEGFADTTAFLAQQYLYCPRLQDQTVRKLIPTSKMGDGSDTSSTSIGVGGGSAGVDVTSKPILT